MVRQFFFQRDDRINSFFFLESLRGRPGAKISCQARQCELRPHVKGFSRSEFFQRKFQRTIILLNESSLRRPVRSHDLVVKSAHRTIERTVSKTEMSVAAQHHYTVLSKDPFG